MADEFLTTRWSLVFAAAEEDAPAASAAMEQLCRDAWRPLYAFARRWGCTREDAEDAVQGFIASVLSRQSFGQLEAGRGRFRSFLLAGTRNHLSDLHAKANAAKRGGGALHFSLDAEAAEQGYASFAADKDSAKKLVDNGMTLVTPPPAMIAELRKKSDHLLAEFIKKVPSSQAPVKAYLAEVKRA